VRKNNFQGNFTLLAKLIVLPSAKCARWQKLGALCAMLVVHIVHLVLFITHVIQHNLEIFLAFVSVLEQMLPYAHLILDVCAKVFASCAIVHLLHFMSK
jgi:hypothetical protein